MICNELKEKLPLGWKDKFVHRDLWDPEGYGVASFDLEGSREKVLVINYRTEDIMEYFYDDFPDDEWISLDRIGYINRKISLTYRIQTTRKVIDLWNYIIYDRHQYPTISFRLGKNIKKSIPIHRIVALIFVPNPKPDEFKIVNHIDLNKTNFHKENLEWCNHRWNSQFKKSTKRKIQYKNLTTNKIYSQQELDRLGILDKVKQSIYRNKKFLNTFWERVDPNLEDYLSRHPLQDDWYYHPTIPNVRANSCGVLEIDGTLKVGTYDEKLQYLITIKNYCKGYPVHRLLYECYHNIKLESKNIIDHIFPVSKEDIDNSISNLRLTNSKGNSNNPLSKIKVQKRIFKYDLFGNLIKEYKSVSEAKEETSIQTLSPEDKLRITAAGFIWVSRKEDLFEKLKYVYYRWKAVDGKFILEDAGIKFNDIYKKSIDRGKYLSESSIIKRKYLNTGMPAPDGYYYQQGDPQNMIYDPSNKDLIKKREEKKWINRRTKYKKKS